MRAILNYVPQPPLTEVVRAAVLDKDVEGARRAIRKYRAAPVNSYANFESDLNRLGHILMEQKQIEAAIQIFELKVESYPDSANVYDSLREAYANHGDRELAIKTYEKSIRLNPNNQGAKEALGGSHTLSVAVPGGFGDCLRRRPAKLTTWASRRQPLPYWMIEGLLVNRPEPVGKH